MELLRGFNPRPAHPENPQIDLQCAIADIRDLGRVIRRNAFNFGTNVDSGNTSIEYDPSDDSLMIHQELSRSMMRDITVACRTKDKDGGLVVIGYLDSNGSTFEEYVITVPFRHNRFRFEVTDGHGVNGEEDVEEFNIEDLTDKQKICKAVFIRKVLQTVTLDLP